jgi:hypothetical protein
MFQIFFSDQYIINASDPPYIQPVNWKSANTITRSKLNDAPDFLYNIYIFHFICLYLYCSLLLIVNMASNTWQDLTSIV